MRRLAEVLAERAAKKEPMKHQKNHAAFLACLEEVKEAFEAGWTIKDIWEALREEKRISFGYEVFRGYVRRMIQDQHAGKPAADVPASRITHKEENPARFPETQSMAPTSRSAGENTVSKKRGTKIAESQGIPTFKWNPNPKPEELF